MKGFLILLLQAIALPVMAVPEDCYFNLSSRYKFHEPRILQPEFYTDGTTVEPEKRDYHRLARILEDAGYLPSRGFMLLPEGNWRAGFFRLGETLNTTGIFLRPRDVDLLREHSPLFYLVGKGEEVRLMIRLPPGQSDEIVRVFRLGKYRQYGVINATEHTLPMFRRFYVAFHVQPKNSLHLVELRDQGEEVTFELKSTIWPRWREFTTRNFRMLVRLDTFVTEASGQHRPIYSLDPRGGRDL